MSREVERGFESWTFSLQVVPQQQCNGHCICDSVQARQLKQQLRSAQVAAQRRGDTALTFPLFWWRSTVSPVEPSLFRPVSPPPPPPLPPAPVSVPNKHPRFCGRKAIWSRCPIRRPFPCRGLPYVPLPISLYWTFLLCLYSANSNHYCC